MHRIISIKAILRILLEHRFESISMWIYKLSTVIKVITYIILLLPTYIICRNWNNKSVSGNEGNANLRLAWTIWFFVALSLKSPFFARLSRLAKARAQFFLRIALTCDCVFFLFAAVQRIRVSRYYSLGDRSLVLLNMTEIDMIQYYVNICNICTIEKSKRRKSTPPVGSRQFNFQCMLRHVRT